MVDAKSEKFSGFRRQFLGVDLIDDEEGGLLGSPQQPNKFLVGYR